MRELPDSLVRFEAELVAAAARRRRGPRIPRLLLLTLALSGAGAGLAVATDAVDNPFARAPRAPLYELRVVAADGSTELARCDAGAGDPRCTAGPDGLALQRLASALQAEGARSGAISLRRLCRHDAGCRTVARLDERRIRRDELAWTSVAALRPPPAGEPIVAFTAAAPIVPAGGTLVAVEGGPLAGDAVDCDEAPGAPLCGLERDATTASGVLDVPKLLRSAGARARVVEVGRRCRLAGDGRCRPLAPPLARELVAHPERLAVGEAVTYERQVMRAGFPAPPPRAKPQRR